MKRFIKWIQLKKRLHGKVRKPAFMNQGEIWWINFGENVGTEINGKGRKFARPAVIFKKLSIKTFLIIPLTSQPKEGSWYVNFIYKEKNQTACLHQIRIVDYRRFDTKIGRTSTTIYNRIRRRLAKLYLTKNKPH